MRKTRIKIIDERSKQMIRVRLNEAPEGGLVYVEFGPAEETRTQAQNRLMWKWFQCIAEETGYTKQQAHDVFCREINGTTIVKDLRGVEREVINGTRGMTVKIMAKFLQQVEFICGEMGWHLPIPDDYAYIIGD